MRARIRMLLVLVVLAPSLISIQPVAEEPVREETANVLTDAVATKIIVASDLARGAGGSPATVEERQKEYQAKKEALQEQREEDRKEENIITFPDGNVLFWTVEEITENLEYWFSEEEIHQLVSIVRAEDEIADSNTIWAAHAWCILNRVDSEEFPNDIISVLAAPGQFTETYTEENLAAPINPEVEWAVKDTMARYIYEKMGAPAEMVGRVLPKDILFFRSSGTKYDYFYQYCWGNRYDPFDSLHNPYYA